MKLLQLIQSPRCSGLVVQVTFVQFQVTINELILDTDRYDKLSVVCCLKYVP